MTPLLVAGAVVLDLVIGEPPTRVHPVVWMGKLVSWFEQRAPKGSSAQLLWGGLIALTGMALSYGLTWEVMQLLTALHPVAAVLGGMVLLKTTFAISGLGRQALRVKAALQDDQLEVARVQVQQLVSRPAGTLTDRQVLAATIESVAENTLDSVVAPLFWFALLGVPGAMAYRFVNTADAMIGYRGTYEHLGKAAARLDDALNWAPARLTAGLLIVASSLAGYRTVNAWQTLQRDHALTASPNAGVTMSTVAGALAVPLEKAGFYRLGDAPDRHLIPRKITDAVILMGVSAGLMVLLIAGLQAGTALGSLPWAP